MHVMQWKKWIGHFANHFNLTGTTGTKGTNTTIIFVPYISEIPEVPLKSQSFTSRKHGKRLRNFGDFFKDGLAVIA